MFPSTNTHVMPSDWRYLLSQKEKLALCELAVASIHNAVDVNVLFAEVNALLSVPDSERDAVNVPTHMAIIAFKLAST